MRVGVITSRIDTGGCRWRSLNNLGARILDDRMVDQHLLASLRSDNTAPHVILLENILSLAILLGDRETDRLLGRTLAIEVTVYRKLNRDMVRANALRADDNLGTLLNDQALALRYGIVLCQGHNRICRPNDG